MCKCSCSHKGGCCSQRKGLGCLHRDPPQCQCRFHQECTGPLGLSQSAKDCPLESMYVETYATWLVPVGQYLPIHCLPRSIGPLQTVTPALLVSPQTRSCLKTLVLAGVSIVPSWMGWYRKADCFGHLKYQKEL